jgi:hypothetical protein
MSAIWMKAASLRPGVGNEIGFLLSFPIPLYIPFAQKRDGIGGGVALTFYLYQGKWILVLF